MIFNDIPRKHHVLIRHMDHGIARRMGAPDFLDVYAPVAQINRCAVAECGGWPCQAGDAFMAFKQAWKALKLAVPIFLPPLGHHCAGGI